MFRSSLSIGIVFILINAACAHAQPAPGNSGLAPGESFTLDPATGDYVITYVGENGESRRSVFEPATKINPLVHSSLKMNANGQISYRYTLQSGSDSRQPISSFQLQPISMITASRPPIRNDAEFNSLDDHEAVARTRACGAAIVAPAKWKGACSTTEDGIRIPFRPRDLNNPLAGVPPGQTLEGFGFDSEDLPIIANARLRGNSARWKEGKDPTPGDGDNYEISDALDKMATEIMGIDDNSVHRYSAVPRLEVPNPFNCAALLERTRDHIKPWPTQQLMELAFNAKMVGLLDNAIAACKNPGPAMSQASAIKALNEIRTELRKKYPGLEAEGSGVTKNQSLAEHDQRLAARVLDFNVTYVFNKLTGGK